MLQFRILRPEEVKAGIPYVLVQVSTEAGAKLFPAILEELHAFDSEIVRAVKIVGLDSNAP